MEQDAYEQKQETDHIAYEARCKRCGVCCGSQDNDPCVHLKRQESGEHFCDAYANRFGVQKTVSGKDFTCVMIRDVLKFGVHYEGCGYDA